MISGLCCEKLQRFEQLCDPMARFGLAGVEMTDAIPELEHACELLRLSDWLLCLLMLPFEHLTRLFQNTLNVLVQLLICSHASADMTCECYRDSMVS